MIFKNKFKNTGNIKYKLKLFTLMGLMGTMTACKDVLEPDNPGNKTNTQYHLSGNECNNTNFITDSLMQNVSDIDNLRLYNLGEENLYFTIETNGSFVSSITLVDDPLRTSDGIINPVTYDRISGPAKDTADFMGRPYWNYWVDLPGGKFDGWEICGISDAEYTSKYEPLSYNQMADLAQDSLAARGSNSSYSAAVCNSIRAGNGEWSRYPGKYGLSDFSIKTYGHDIGLRCSDIVRLTARDGNEEWHMNLSAIDLQSAVDKNTMPANMVFKGSAYANVNKQEDDETYESIQLHTDSAIFIVDAAKNETIVMPFDNWYKVTIIKSGDNITSYFEDLPATASNWAIQYPLTATMDTSDNEIQPSGMFVSRGKTELDYTETFDIDQNLENSPEGTKVGEKTTSAAGIYSRMATNYFKYTNPVSTGLTNVYCAPARNRATSDDEGPTEVIVQGNRNDRTSSGVTCDLISNGQGQYYQQPLSSPHFTAHGTFFGFVFGGTRQR